MLSTEIASSGTKSSDLCANPLIEAKNRVISVTYFMTVCGLFLRPK